jgi:two-component system NtrC family response regulator
MSLFVVSSDWRFKEKFKLRYRASFLTLFTMTEKALHALRLENPSLLIVDSKLGKCTQDEFLDQLIHQQPTCPILFCLDSGMELPERARQTLSLHTIQRLLLDWEALFSHLDCLANAETAEETEAPYHPSGLIGESDGIRNVRKQLMQYAHNSCSIHLFGETGTGKELAANYLHSLQYPHRSMVSVNCSLLSGALGNSMFFGHTKGAFTDGKTELKGFAYEADQSTLFLDEVENLSLQFQADLLRLLETGHYRHYGDTHLHTSHFRLVTASNEKLKDLISKQSMRKDFFYRITDVSLTLPPLREHKEDIPLLCSYFLNLHAPGKILSDKNMHLLENHSWPGNVRELFSTLRRGLLRCQDSEVVSLLPEDICLA